MHAPQDSSPVCPPNLQLPSTDPRWPSGAWTGQGWLVSLQEEPAWSGEASRRGWRDTERDEGLLAISHLH